MFAVVIREPVPFVKSSGADWQYQTAHADAIDALSKFLPTHFTNWKTGRTDKQSHPLFLCCTGPGKGKSRFLQEFRGLSAEASANYRELSAALASAISFHISFYNGTTIAGVENDMPVEVMIGTRMLYQLREDAALTWGAFVANAANRVSVDDVLQRVSDATNVPRQRRTIFLLIDELHRLNPPYTDPPKLSASISESCRLINTGKALHLFAPSLLVSSSHVAVRC